MLVLDVTYLGSIPISSYFSPRHARSDPWAQNQEYRTLQGVTHQTNKETKLEQKIASEMLDQYFKEETGIVPEFPKDYVTTIISNNN